jgi:hypothetical protein
MDTDVGTEKTARFPTCATSPKLGSAVPSSRKTRKSRAFGGSAANAADATESIATVITRRIHRNPVMKFQAYVCLTAASSLAALWKTCGRPVHFLWMARDRKKIFARVRPNLPLWSRRAEVS